MKKWTLMIAMLALGSIASWAGTVCPGAAGANPFPHPPDPNSTGCNVLITIGPSGTVSITVPDSTPYENSEDVLVGVLNNSGVSINSINLTGSGIFGFDGDGICTFTFVGSGYCAGAYYTQDPGDYGGPTTTFSNLANDGGSGSVTFAPGVPANGGTTYFSLEGVPTASITATVGSTGPGGGGGTASAPALSAWGMLLLVVLLVGLSLRMMKQKTA